MRSVVWVGEATFSYSSFMDAPFSEVDPLGQAHLPLGSKKASFLPSLLLARMGFGVWSSLLDSSQRVMNTSVV